MTIDFSTLSILMFLFSVCLCTCANLLKKKVEMQFFHFFFAWVLQFDEKLNMNLHLERATLFREVIFNPFFAHSIPFQIQFNFSIASNVHILHSFRLAASEAVSFALFSFIYSFKSTHQFDETFTKKIWIIGATKIRKICEEQLSAHFICDMNYVHPVRLAAFIDREEQREREREKRPLFGQIKITSAYIMNTSEQFRCCQMH